jgi:hypothetical protein
MKHWKKRREMPIEQDKYRQYEAAKKELQRKNLTAEEYAAAIKQLAEKLKI